MLSSTLTASSAGLPILVLLALPTGVAAADLEPPSTAETETSSLTLEPVQPGALVPGQRATARIYFFDPERRPHSHEELLQGNHVSQTIVNLVGALLPGDISLENTGAVQALRGVVDKEVLRDLFGQPGVLAIDLEGTVDSEPVTPIAGFGSTCSPSSTEACVQGGRFGLQVNMSGSATVAATSAQSAVFWRFSSANWEVVAKVLNGCSINNKWWVLGAGATSNAYALSVFDYSSGGSIGYNGAVLCPIADTGQFNTFPCP